MNMKQRYTFILRAESPLHFGGELPGELLLDEEGMPFANGNGIGGALRSYLKQSGVVRLDDIAYYMGDGDLSGEAGFTESRVFISDGKFRGLKKAPGASGYDSSVAEGTAIDPASGAARSKHKYTRHYLPTGTEMCFTIECDSGSEPEQSKAHLSFTDIVYIWAAAIHNQQLQFGGHKSNGYGRFSLIQLGCVELKLDSPEALDDYIFARHKVEATDCTSMALQYGTHFSTSCVLLLMKGRFPYGVYQAFKDQELTVKHVGGSQVSGLQRDGSNHYYLPGSSLKGVMRHELRRLLLRMAQDTFVDQNLSEQDVNKLVEEWFGGTDKAGALTVRDVKLHDAQSVKVLRTGSTKVAYPAYIRIDRITGGVIDGAMKTQHEVSGEAEIYLELHGDTDVEAKLFPLLYVLRRIGTGQLPLGGRTAIGLGQFEAGATEIRQNGNVERLSNGELTNEEKQQFERYYNCFVEYVREWRNQNAKRIS